MEILGSSLDELLHKAYAVLLKQGKKICPTKGECLELIDVGLKLNNPRARFSGTEKRGAILFSALGETLWCFSGSDKLAFIEYYIPGYRKYIKADTKTKEAPGAYGPRLFSGGSHFEKQEDLFQTKCQVQKIIDFLTQNPSTRQAVLAIYREKDIEKSKGDVPCTCIIQLLCRDNKLNMIVYMRSNDAYRGLPHDVFVFTFLQEYIACSIGKSLGSYSHHVGSFHLYTNNGGAKKERTDRDKAEEFLKEEKNVRIAMPAMPRENPYSAVKWLLEREREIRNGRILPRLDLSNMNPYWLDIARLLIMKYYSDKKEREKLREVAKVMHSDVYKDFIADKIKKIQDDKAQLKLF